MKRYLRILFCLSLFAWALTSCQNDELERLADRVTELEKNESEPEPEPDPEIVQPTSIAWLNVGPVRLERGGKTAVEFRLNPSDVQLDLEQGADQFLLDRVGEHSAMRQFDVSASANVRLVAVERVRDSVTQEPKPGQYRAILEDCSYQVGYDELLTLVLAFHSSGRGACEVSSSAIEVVSERMTTVDTGLPIVLIETPDGLPITSRSEWTAGVAVTILSPQRLVEYQDTIELKGRGNTSWGFAKKPYAMRLGQKTSLLGMPKHKRWCLLAGWSDRTLIRNAVAFELARRTGLDWTPTGRHVELVVNGVHQGNYFLCEQIKIDKNRLDLSDPKEPVADRGYLFELDTYFDEQYKWHSPVRNLPWQFKDPDEVTPEQQAFAEQYVAEMESALYDPVRFARRDFVDYMDLASLADYWMVYEMAQLWEPNHPKSVYMHKDVGGRMKAGPVWDFDMGGFAPRDAYFFVDTKAVYYDQLFEDAGFRQIVHERWKAQRDGFLDVANFIDSLANTLRASERLNYPMWPINIVSAGDETIDDYDVAIARMKDALVGKIRWMDRQIEDF